MIFTEVGVVSICSGMTSILRTQGADLTAVPQSVVETTPTDITVQQNAEVSTLTPEVTGSQLSGLL